jgi:hypothetical protein
MSLVTLCNAIAGKRVVQFNYSGDSMPGSRLVEPHMVAYSSSENLVLSGWFLGGASESKEGQDWRSYLLSAISNVVILPQTFAPRPGYRSDGGKRFHHIQCAV